ncbi:MAG: type II toxin-antitoxin system VapC family toxin [Anaerolineae bacterium]
MYLVDTNVWLERLLDQERSEEVGRFLGQIPSDQLMMTDFALHSVGVVLDRLGQRDILLAFVDDVFLQGDVILVALRPEDMHRLVIVAERFNLDFDDAYQYVAAELAEAVIVSLDGDFDCTDKGRQSPGSIVRCGDVTGP